MICQNCRALLRANTIPLRASPPARHAAAILAPSALPRLQQQRVSRPSRRTSIIPSRAFTTTSTARLASSSEESEPPSPMTPTESGIASQLAEALAPTESVLVQDVSGGCGSMYAIDITAERFRGQTMLKQQRMVNAALGDLVKGWHGVQIKTRVPPSS